MQFSLFIADHPEVILVTYFNTVTLMADLCVDMFTLLEVICFWDGSLYLRVAASIPTAESHPSRELLYLSRGFL